MELSVNNYDFAGWATCSNKLCSDGRTILPDAFKHHDGDVVPLVWNHQHNDVNNILGKALLHSRDGGMYAYCMFNDTESGQAAKKIVLHGDICSLSICANQLKHDNKRGVTHGKIREVSLVLAGANPGALIDTVVKHGEGADEEEEAIIYNGELLDIPNLESDLNHAEEGEENNEKENTAVAEEVKPVEAVEEVKAAEAEEVKHAEEAAERTVEDVYNTLNEEQKDLLHAMVAKAIEDTENKNKKTDKDNSEGGNETMKHNVFDNEENKKNEAVLTHADKDAIIELAKKPGVASLKSAIKMYTNENEQLAHAFDQTDADTVALLFPEPHLINPGAPEIIRDYDQSWVMKVINKIKKSPYTKIRTRKADARGVELQAKGYQNKGDQKKIMNQIKLLKRETSPQTVYIKDELHRDDIVDIDWDTTAFQLKLMNDQMYETLALAALISDGREDTDPDKIHETNIRSIYHDDDFYCMHYDVDIEAAKAALQGTNTSANFGENYIYSEAIITAALYSREKFKGTGQPTLYCTPHLVNVMLLARDLNGRRIYNSKADLTAALNVAEIVEIEQLEGQKREGADGNERKLLGLFVNLADYTFGCAKGGQLTKFEDFDIDFNKYKYLLETRLSGSLTEPYSAIALEEPVAAE